MVKRAYTLLELIVVIGVIGVIAVMAFYGLSTYDKTQLISTAQKDFLSDFRAAQNKITSGGEAAVYKLITIYDSTNYNIDGVPKRLPNGIIMTTNSVFPLVVCIANKNLLVFQSDNCGTCPGGQFYACNNTAKAPISTGSVTITFQDSPGTISKSVVIEGSGMTINRVYAQ